MSGINRDCFMDDEDLPPVGTTLSLAIPEPPRVDEDPEYLDECFGPGGHLARAAGAAYEVRPGQIALARLIDRAIRGEHHALAEGPCGTGKGIAYLVPAIYHAVHSGKTVVIATANIALQDQLIEKDLPALQAALPWTFSFHALKGRSNYWCMEKFENSENSGALGGQRALVDWGLASLTGDKKELPMLPTEGMWSLVSTTSEECLGDGCLHLAAGKCHYERAKRTARGANIVVTNLHVLGAHLSLRQQTEMDLILPPFDVCIIDEAHELPAAMREFFGFTVTERNVERLSRTVRGILRGQGALADSLERAAHHFFTEVGAYVRPKGSRVRLVDAAGFCDASPLLKALGAVESAAGHLEQTEMEHCARLGLDGENTPAGKLGCRLKERAGRMITHVAQAVGQEEPDKNVYWVEFHAKDIRRNHPRIECRPLRVGGIMKGELFDLTKTVALVSATLTTTPGNFAFIRNETGIPRDALELMVPSPFDLERQCLAILPDCLPGQRKVSLPDPKEKDYGERLVPFFQYILDVCDGRVLGLFTSYKNLETIAEEVTSPHPILVQERGGGLPRGELVRQFKADTHSSLFGTDSFWTGIDVVGESLTAVVIDKIPFEHQDDPLIAAMKEASDDEFWPWYTNRAIIRLRQGVGRLIRAQTDIGVIVILDERIKTKKYGLQMAKSLGPMRKSRKLDEIIPFLKLAAGAAERNRAAFQAAQAKLLMEPKKPKPAGIRVPRGVF